MTGVSDKYFWKILYVTGRKVGSIHEVIVSHSFISSFRQPISVKILLYINNVLSPGDSGARERHYLENKLFKNILKIQVLYMTKRGKITLNYSRQFFCLTEITFIFQISNSKRSYGFFIPDQIYSRLITRLRTILCILNPFCPSSLSQKTQKKELMATSDLH